MQTKRIVASDGTFEEWRVDHELHREDGPGHIEYENGEVVVEEWWLNGWLHRVDGPAYIEYKDGRVIYEQWYLGGEILTKKDFTSIEMIDRMKAYNLFNPIEIARLRKNAD